MAGRPEGDTGATHGQAGVTTEELEAELESIKRRLFDAIRDHDGRVESDAAVATLQRKHWNMVALLHNHLGERRLCTGCGEETYVFAIDAAAKASDQAVKQGALAVKLSKATLADRVLALEQGLEGGKRRGRGIAEEARRRKKE